MTKNQKTYSLFEKVLLEIPKDWQNFLGLESITPSLERVSHFLESEIKNQKKVFPPFPKVFEIFKTISPSQVRVVVLGQDPYHGDHQAIGVSFAVPNDHFPKPPSLKNIFKELQSSLKKPVSEKSSDLSGWTSQGVFLLNTVLTVRAHEALSHRDQGWEEFTDLVFQRLSKRKEPLVFILWGSHAQKKKQWIEPQHFVLASPHPSPLSAHRGFFGSDPFTKTNEFLLKNKFQPVDWEKTSL